MISENYHHYFKKSLGQNFLKNKNILHDFVDTLEISSDDLVIEIGPGKGSVTDVLLDKSPNVLLVEKDDSLIPYLNDKFHNKVKIIHEDVLKVNFKKITESKPYKVIGSLPYNISKKIIYNLLVADHKPEKMSLILQEEVAKNYGAIAPRATLLSNFANLYSDVKLHKVISSKYFTPEPKVNGQIITFSNIKNRHDYNKELWRLIRIGFASPRKILSSNLRSYDKDHVTKLLTNIGLNEKTRAGELTLGNWIDLYSALHND